MATTYDLVTVTTEPSQVNTTPTLFTEAFGGADGTAWPTGWTLSAAGGADLAGFTQQAGMGREALPSLGGYPTMSARRDTGAADVEVVFDVTGSFDATSGPAEHYREMMVRLDPAADPAGRLADGYYVQVYPSGSAPTTKNWHVKLRRRKGGVNTNLGADHRTIAPAVRAMKGRFRAVGDRVQMRVWDAALAEPTTWMTDVVDVDPVLTGTGVALVAVGGNLTGAGRIVDWDNVAVSGASAGPNVTSISAPAKAIWPDGIPLTVDGSNFTAVRWSVVSGPGGGTFDDAASDSTTFRPATAGGTYVLRATLSTSGAADSADVSTAVYAQMWQKTDTGKRPVAMIANGAVATTGSVSLTDRDSGITWSFDEEATVVEEPTSPTEPVVEASTIAQTFIANTASTGAVALDVPVSAITVGRTLTAHLSLNKEASGLTVTDNDGGIWVGTTEYSGTSVSGRTWVKADATGRETTITASWTPGGGATGNGAQMTVAEHTVSGLTLADQYRLPASPSTSTVTGYGPITVTAPPDLPVIAHFGVDTLQGTPTMTGATMVAGIANGPGGIGGRIGANVIPAAGTLDVSAGGWSSDQAFLEVIVLDTPTALSDGISGVTWSLDG